MSNKNIITNCIENLYDGYFFYVGSIHLKMKKEYGLSSLDILLFIHFLTLNKTKKFQSASKIAEIMEEDKRAVSASIKKLKEKGLLFETKVSYHFSIFNAQLPFRFKSKFVADHMTGCKNNIKLIKFMSFLSVQNCTDRFYSRYIYVPIIFKSIQNCTDCGPKVNHEKVNKEKVKGHSPLNEKEIREDLINRYDCTDHELDIAFTYMVKNNGIVTPHIFFRSEVKKERFIIILEKANREITLEAEKRQLEKSNEFKGIDLEGISREAKKALNSENSNVLFIEDYQESEINEAYVKACLADMQRHLTENAM